MTKRSGSFVERWGRYTRQPGSTFITAATCSLSNAASASPLPFAARIFATTVSTLAIGLLALWARSRACANEARPTRGRTSSGRELGEDCSEVVRVDRLQEMRVEPGGLRALAIERLPVAADRHEPHVGAARHRAQAPRDLEAVDAGQAEIDQGDRELDGLRVVEAVLAAGRRHHLVAVELEQQAQAFARVVVVLDDEDARRTRGRRCGRARRCRRRGARGQAHHQLAAASFAGAERLDGAAVQLHEPPYQGQAQAEAIGARVTGDRKSV